MVPRKRILFIINPISGGKGKETFKQQALATLDLVKFEPTFQETTHVNHATELALQAIQDKYDAVVAVGGDGTINEIGMALIGSTVPLGIIPKGSGNGLALFLGIPLQEREALQCINKFEPKAIDSGEINKHKFFNMAGLGFDACVSQRFAVGKTRGPMGYFQAMLHVLANFEPKEYKLRIDGKKYARKAFMISVANSPQYGNNAYISPHARIDDGLLDVCIVRKFPLYVLPKLIYHLFNRSADQSKYVEIIPGKDIEIQSACNNIVHIDGEPLELGEKLEISITPQSLQVIC